MPGPESDPSFRTGLGKSALVRQSKSNPHSEANGCKPGQTCAHYPTKRARKIHAARTRVARMEWNRKKGR